MNAFFRGLCCACALIFAATYILLNLSADIVSIVTNPRLLHPK